VAAIDPVPVAILVKRLRLDRQGVPRQVLEIGEDGKQVRVRPLGTDPRHADPAFETRIHQLHIVETGFRVRIGMSVRRRARRGEQQRHQPEKCRTRGHATGS
jgi:hypothetical protein